jgi:hypothetical protein
MDTASFDDMSPHDRPLAERIVDAIWVSYEYGAQLAADPREPGGTPEWWIVYRLPRSGNIAENWPAQIALRSERELASLAAMKGVRWKRHPSGFRDFMIEAVTPSPEAALSVIERALSSLGFGIDDSDIWFAKADNMRRAVDLPPELLSKLTTLGFAPSEAQRAAYARNLGRVGSDGIFPADSPIE